MDYKPSLCCLTFLLMFLHQSLTKTRRRYGEGDIRLVGGGRRWRGTVLILKRGKWSAICDEMWGLNDATVACRQMGYKGAIQAPIRSKYGPGRKRKWMTQFRCRGTEKRLTQCISGRRRYGDRCGGLRHSAGVVCTRNPITLREIWKRYGISFVTMSSTTTTSKTKPTITKTTPTTTTTTTTTTPPPTTTTTITTTTTTTTTSTTTPETTTKHVMSELEEEILEWASHHPQNETDEEEKEPKDNTDTKLERPKNDAASIDLGNGGLYVISQHSNSSTNPISKTKHFIKYSDGNVLKLKAGDEEDTLVLADKPLDTSLEIRLKGGRYVYEGHLEVRFKGGDWGVICADHWTLREVGVACRESGGIGQGKQPLQFSYFGGSEKKKIVHQIQCIGREETLSDCTITPTNDDHKCSVQTSVAGIVCSDDLPDLVPNIKALEASARLQDQPLFYLRCSMEEYCLSSSAYVIRNTSLVWRNNMRRLFRFSTVVHNRGVADFRPYRAKNQWEWHACHMHYHSMEVFAHYDLMNDEGYRLAEGSKASFCLEDTVCDKGTKPKYNCRGVADQGLSVNCSDNYMYDIDCQWIDVTDLEPGSYTFLLEVNPNLLVAESSFENNVVQCNMFYSGYYATLRNCEFQSLLDYRRPLKMPP